MGKNRRGLKRQGGAIVGPVIMFGPFDNELVRNFVQDFIQELEVEKKRVLAQKGRKQKKRKKGEKKGK